MRRLIKSGAKFLVVGGISTVIELALFNLFVLVFDWAPVAAKVVSSLVALVNAYVGNREWAFRHRRGRGRGTEASLFLLVNGACTALGAGLVALGVLLTGDAGPLALNVINLASIAVVVVVRFMLYHFVVFRSAAPGTVSPAAAEGSAQADLQRGSRSQRVPSAPRT